MSEFIIYHNPRCSKSRQTLQILHDNGIEPTICEYLKDVPSKETLSDIISLLQINAHDLLRTKESEYQQAKLSIESSADDIISAMRQYPKLIERPIVVKDHNQAIIGRPPENALQLING